MLGLGCCHGSPDVLVAVVHGLVGGDGDGEELAGELQTGLVLEHNGATVDAEQIIDCIILYN